WIGEYTLESLIGGNIPLSSTTNVAVWENIPETPLMFLGLNEGKWSVPAADCFDRIVITTCDGMLVWNLNLFAQSRIVSGQLSRDGETVSLGVRFLQWDKPESRKVNLKLAGTEQRASLSVDCDANGMWMIRENWQAATAR